MSGMDYFSHFTRQALRVHPSFQWTNALISQCVITSFYNYKVYLSVRKE
jgi:hypothetical protein